MKRLTIDPGHAEFVAQVALAFSARGLDYALQKLVNMAFGGDYLHLPLQRCRLLRWHGT